MPKLPEQKVGIIACSGEELAEGTVTRLAALKVLHETRRGKTVTICLPLFLAGGEGDRAFARFHPTITIDGCDLRCAARGTEMYSGKPAASLVITDVAAECGLGKIEGRRRLNAAGEKAVDIAAQRLTELVDKILGHPAPARVDDTLVNIEPSPAATVGCSCSSGIPVSKIDVDGKSVDVFALPLIFQHFRKAGRGPESAGEDLFAMVKIYNPAPSPGEEQSYREAILREYAAFCRGVTK